MTLVLGAALPKGCCASVRAPPISPPPHLKPPPVSTPEIEAAEGANVVIAFEGKRCIHARFCVLQQPGVFKANVVGPWLAPDDARRKG